MGTKYCLAFAYELMLFHRSASLVFFIVMYFMDDRYARQNNVWKHADWKKSQKNV